MGKKEAHGTRINSMMRKISFTILSSILFLALLSSCNQKKNGTTTSNTETANSKPETISVPQFNSDSSYDFVKVQCDFGPRVPNTKQHDACASYLSAKLKTYTPNVIVQKGVVTTYDNIKLNIQNKP